MTIPFRRLTMLLTAAATALTATPHPASAHTSQNPPQGCAKKAATSGNYSARVTICLTETWKTHTYGERTLEPTDTITLECWYGIVLSSNAHCSMNSKVSLAKDGVHAWTEQRSNTVSLGRTGKSSTYTDHYACRGNGEYELRFEGGTATITTFHHATATVAIPAFSVKARGCA